jgi:hypothetical protein
VGAAGLGGPAGSQPAAVALELVLAIDASGSIDVDEWILQRQGFAAAFRDPEVVAAIEASEGGIAVSVVQWSGRWQQAVVVDWLHLTDAASAGQAADLLARMDRSLLGETALGEALAFALRQLGQSPYAGRRQTIDISGDGKTNTGGEPDRLRDAAVARGITINALAILNEQADLADYYWKHLVGGPGAFVIEAADLEQFAEAIRRKLLLEIRGGPIAARPPPAKPG